MIDWITILIELVGIAILLMWIVIPIREFRDILRVIRNKPYAPPDAAGDPRRGFPVEPNPAPPRREDGPRA